MIKKVLLAASVVTAIAIGGAYAFYRSPEKEPVSQESERPINIDD